MKTNDAFGIYLLDRLFPGKDKIIDYVEDDAIWFNISPEEIDTISVADTLLLARCQIYLNEDVYSLYMPNENLST